MITIGFNVHDGGTDPSPSRHNYPGWNSFGPAPTATGIMVADLLDSNGNPTGVSVEALTLPVGDINSNALSLSSADPDIPYQLGKTTWYYSGTSADTQRIAGLPAGASYTMRILATASDTTRDTNHYVTAGTPSPALYDYNSADPIPAPTPITGVVPADGILNITVDGIQSYGYVAAWLLEYEPNIAKVELTCVADFKDTALPSSVAVNYTIHDATTGALVGSKGTATVTNGALTISSSAMSFTTEYAFRVWTNDRTINRSFFATTAANPA